MRKLVICLYYIAVVPVFGQAVPYGVEFRVNTYIKNDQWWPRITTLTGGGFVICWMSYGHDGSDSDIYGQVFSFDGTKIGLEFRVNTYIEDSQAGPHSVAPAPIVCLLGG